jgi:hypothetical protein
MGEMTTTRTRSRGTVLAVGAAGAVLAGAMLSDALLAAPQASAACSMSPADDQYISLLAQNKMVHTADFNDCTEATEGRWFANEVSNAPDPLGKGKDLVKFVTSTTPMSSDQAEWEVESAVYVYAPQMIPKMKDQAGQQAPAPAA